MADSAKTTKVTVDFDVNGVSDLENATAALNEIGSASGNTSADLDAADTALQALGDSANETGTSFVELAAKSELMGQMQEVIGKVSEALVECVESAAEFETAIAKVSTIADTSETSIDEISNSILELSNETGDSATALSASVYSAISASVDTADAVDFVAQASALAAGGFTDTETAVDVLTTAINAYGLEASDAATLSDYLITTQNLGKTTVDELADSMGRVIPLASAYNVDMANLSSSYALLTKNGIATNEATTYLTAILNELGDSGSTVSGILQEQTGMSFAELSEAGYSLGDVMGVLGDSVNNDATAFSNLWSQQTAGVGALSLLNSGTAEYNNILSEMTSSAGAANAAYETMNNTLEDAQEDLSTSAENLKIAIGDTLLDAFSGVNSALSELLNGITSFVQEHPTITAAITGIGVALGVMAAAFTAVTFAVNVLKPAIVSLGLTIDTALPIVGAISVAVGLITAGVSALSSVLSDGAEEVEDYDGTMEECRNEIETTETALEKAKEAYGENSDTVAQLEDELDTLNKQYEKGGGEIGELAEQVDAATESFQALQEAQADTASEIDTTETSGLRAVSMLEALSDKTEKTSADLDLMQSYADYLNDTFNCNIVVDYDTGDLTGFDPNEVVNEVINTANSNRQAAAEAYITDSDFVNSYIDAYSALQEAQEKKAELETQAYNDFYQQYVDTVGSATEASNGFADAADYAEQSAESYLKSSSEEYVTLESEIADAESTLSGMNSTLDEQGELAGMTEAGIEDYKDALANAAESGEELAEVTEDAADATSDYESECASVNGVIEAYADEILTVAEAYEEAYDAAHESFSGQFALFDEASTESETYLASTVEAAQSAMDSQLAYWNTYSENIGVIQTYSAEQLGVTQADYDAFMAHVQSGTEEAAGLADSMAQALESGNTDAVTNLIETNAELSATYDAMSADVADWQTGYTDTVNQTVSDIETAIGELDLSAEANTYATNTMNSFTSALQTSGSTAISEAQSIVTQIQAVFDGANISYSVSGSSSGTVEGNANGTTNSADVFLAGEEGAELVVGKSGSTVFPASETAEIIQAVSDYTAGYTPSNSGSYVASSSNTTIAPNFQLTLNGGTNQVNKQQVKKWMQDTMNDAFAGVLRTNPSVYAI